ncbi:MAG: family 43 glycosylhydrolase [Oscillospiraceae bacterium]|nr:family 43 glycosylhydrolase [Oscillospiraceae bacterium]
MRKIRIICLVMALSLVLSAMPTAVFGSEEALTRVEFLEKLADAFDIRERLYSGSFSDVSAKDGYADMVEGALAAGVINIDDGKFRPNDTITYMEAWTMAYMAMQRNLTKFPIYWEGEIASVTEEYGSQSTVSAEVAEELIETRLDLAAVLPVTVGDDNTDHMLNYIRNNIDEFDNKLMAPIAEKYYDDAINRFINGSESDKARAKELTALAYGAMFPERDRFMNSAPIYDQNGGLVQAHGGGIIWDEATQKYYWYGEARGASEVPEHLQRYAGWGWRIGVACYSSSDLYNWTYEGLALEMLESTDEAPLKYPESDIRVGEVLERPKVLYNEATGKYVMWMHIDNGWYGYSRAGVAVADSPTGPFEYLESFRPGDKMSRDMTVYQDDDGAAYIYFSTDENSSLAVCRLSDDYLSCEGEATYAIPGGWREAPALFKYNNTYYMITSGCTGWDPNAADYATAPSPLGPWTRHGNPCKGDGADLTYGGQSAYILPIDAEKGHFIFIADTWRPSHHDESGFIWLPIEVKENGTIRIDWLDEWTLEDIGVKIIEPDTIFVKYGETVQLPDIIFAEGERFRSHIPVDWSRAGIDYNMPGHYFVEGFFADTTTTAEIYNIPKNLIYFADCGADNTTEFDVINGLGELLNSVPDQAYGVDEKTGKTWGYIADNSSGRRDDSNMFRSVRYDYGGKVGDGLTYKFEVDPSEAYDVFVGVYDPWGEKARKVDIKVQGYIAADGLAPAAGQKVISRSGIIAADGTITVSTVRDQHAIAGNLDPVISWIMISKANGVNIKAEPLGLTYPEAEEKASEPEAEKAEEAKPLYTITGKDGAALSYSPDQPMVEALTTAEFASGETQLWSFTYTLTGSYIVESSAEFEAGDSTEKRALDVLNHNPDPGIGIIAYRTAGGENQRWFLEKQGGGTYLIRSELSGLYLTEKDGRFTQEELGADGNQTWIIEIYNK